MEHIKNIHIKGFRALKNVKLPDLASINLFVGGNNSGKTSMLEAIELHCNPLDIRKLVLIARGRDRFQGGNRSLPLLDSVTWLFPVKKHLEGFEDIGRGSIEMSSTLLDIDDFVTKASYSEKRLVDFNDDQLLGNAVIREFSNSVPSDEEVKALKIELFCNKPYAWTPLDETKNVESKTFVLTDYFRSIQEKHKEPLIPTKMVTPIDHRVQPISAKSLTDTIMSGDKNDVINLLQSFDENIIGLEVLSPDGRNPVPYIKHKKLGYSPLSSFGDGIRRVLTIAQSILRSKNGILLIDEIETAVHVSLFERLFSWIVKSCLSYNIQLFATTHSIEALDSMISTDNELLSQFMAYRIEQKENQTVAKKFIGKDLYELRQIFGQDVR